MVCRMFKSGMQLTVVNMIRDIYDGVCNKRPFRQSSFCDGPKDHPHPPLLKLQKMVCQMGFVPPTHQFCVGNHNHSPSQTVMTNASVPPSLRERRPVGSLRHPSRKRLRVGKKK